MSSDRYSIDSEIKDQYEHVVYTIPILVIAGFYRSAFK